MEATYVPDVLGGHNDVSLGPTVFTVVRFLFQIVLFDCDARRVWIRCQ